MIFPQLKTVLEFAGCSWALVFGILFIPVMLAVIAPVSRCPPRRLQDREDLGRASEDRSPVVRQ